ncbi:MAG: helix-turn-helix domain-containing protein [Oscillospiraceae bacterium]|nr:helix-turn-helix domain-containing protein [Oscillospiraceae bacterium]
MEKNVIEYFEKIYAADEEFRKETDALDFEYQIIRAILNARQAKNITQKQLAELSGINQADISKLERGNANPSVKTLKRLASALDMTLKIEFQPIAH